MKVLQRLKVAKRYDMQRPPFRQMHILRPITWALSFPVTWSRRLQVNRLNMEGIKPPYLLLCTHHAFMDFKVTTAAIFPHRASYVIAIDGFIKREWLLRLVGGICKRKFTNDLQLIRNIKIAIEKGDILALYPEARYSLVGTTAVLPASLAKIARMLKVPVVVLNMHGNYLDSPCWNLKHRKNRLEADLTCIIRAEELSALKVSEVNARIEQAFQYDEYAWQKEQRIAITYRKRAEGLHKVLYQCAHCKTEFQMESHGTTLTCRACEKVWEMGIYGELQAIKMAVDESSLVTEFSHIPDWYEFEREQVRQEIEAGTYYTRLPAYVEALPNARGYIPLGMAELTHAMDGFTLEGTFDGDYFSLYKPVLSMYSCHIEFEYMGKGDCVDLSTLDDTYYIYPQGEHFAVTKMALATEELFQYINRDALERNH